MKKKHKESKELSDQLGLAQRWLIEKGGKMELLVLKNQTRRKNKKKRKTFAVQAEYYWALKSTKVPVKTTSRGGEKKNPRDNNFRGEKATIGMQST